MSTPFQSTAEAQAHWLKRYYYTRAIFSFVWVAVAFAVGTKNPGFAGVLLVLYPAWDAGANWADAKFSGGMVRNRSQTINMWVSLIAALAVMAAIGAGMKAVIAVIGAWAIVAGLLQLSAGLGRWKAQGAQWVMVLSGAQSALAGGHFIAQSRMDTPPTIAHVAGYAGFGALYFLISAILLTVRQARGGRRQSV
jgi:uncharacterized membrane protein HdeD (DUF308 family)